MNEAGARTLFIHIGLAKTGSSAIQKYFHHHREGENYAFVKLGPANHGPQIVRLFSSAPQEHHIVRKLGWGAQQIEADQELTRTKLARSIKRNPGRNLLLSGEGIYQFDGDELARMRDFFAPHFERIVVLGYVRAPRSDMESRFQQSIKGATMKRLVFERLMPDYSRLARYDGIFGRDNVWLRKFDPACLRNGDVVTDFCHWIGVAGPPDAPPRVNESLSREAVALLFMYRSFGPRFGKGESAIRENRLLAGALRAIPGPKLRLDPEQIRRVLADRREQIEWIEQRLGQSLDEDLGSDGSEVRSEEDLLRVNPESVARLRELIGPAHLPEDCAGTTAEQVAALVHALRLKLASEHPEPAKAERTWRKKGGGGGGGKRRAQA